MEDLLTVIMLIILIVVVLWRARPDDPVWRDE